VPNGADSGEQPKRLRLCLALNRKSHSGGATHNGSSPDLFYNAFSAQIGPMPAQMLAGTVSLRLQT
jgi:hypothetical protein